MKLSFLAGVPISKWASSSRKILSSKSPTDNTYSSYSLLTDLLMTKQYYYMNHVSYELDICGHLCFQNKRQIPISLFPLWKRCILEKQKFLPVLFKIALIKNACQVLFISLECLMETKTKEHKWRYIWLRVHLRNCVSSFLFSVRGEAVWVGPFRTFLKLNFPA